jgi:hypothetical protein
VSVWRWRERRVCRRALARLCVGGGLQETSGVCGEVSGGRLGGLQMAVRGRAEGLLRALVRGGVAAVVCRRGEEGVCSEACAGLLARGRRGVVLQVLLQMVGRAVQSVREGAAGGLQMGAPVVARGDGEGCRRREGGVSGREGWRLCTPCMRLEMSGLLRRGWWK